MSARLTLKQDTRTLLLEAGTEIMLEKGYTNTGIQEVLLKAGVPKGSFYHYLPARKNLPWLLSKVLILPMSAN